MYSNINITEECTQVYVLSECSIIIINYNGCRYILILPREELIKVDKAAFNAGNFSCKLVNRLFPELFGPDHLRTRYSYHGQGKVNKSELDPIRKGYIQRYVLYFHPDVKDPKFYQNIVVVKINEMLRRPVKPTNH